MAIEAWASGRAGLFYLGCLAWFVACRAWVAMGCVVLFLWEQHSMALLHGVDSTHTYITYKPVHTDRHTGTYRTVAIACCQLFAEEELLRPCFSILCVCFPFSPPNQTSENLFIYLTRFSCDQIEIPELLFVVDAVRPSRNNLPCRGHRRSTIEM